MRSMPLRRARPWLVLLAAATLSRLSRAPAAVAAPDAASMAAVEEKVREIARTAREKTVAVRIEVGGTTLGFGSGAVISAEGLVLTCAHVTEPAKAGRMVAVFSDGREAPLVVVASNARNDYSLCRVEPAGEGLPHFDLAPKDPALGEYVVALGHPGGPYADHLPSLAVGKVTGVGRNLPILLQGKHYVDAIQTDAPIFGGNSGGPLVDLDGRLAGINGAILLVGDAAFSTPISRIAKDLPTLREGKAVKGERIEDMARAMQSLAEEMDPQELADALSNDGLGQILKSVMQLMQLPSKAGGGGSPRKGAPRRLDDAKASWPTAGAARSVALSKDGKRVGYACTWGAAGGKARFVTCARLVGDGKGLAVGSAVLASDAPSAPVAVLGRDGLLDVALLEEAKADGHGPEAGREPPPPIASEATLGSWVLVEGPGAVPFQAGIVAAVAREVGTDRRIPTIGMVRLFKPPNTSPFRPYPAMTQIDCPIAADQFGAPVVRPDGTVMGVVVAHLNRGCTFVAPYRRIDAAVARMEAGEDVAAPPTYDPSVRAKDAPALPVPEPDAGDDEPDSGLRIEVATLSGVGRPAEFKDAAKGSVPAGPVAVETTGVRAYDVREGDVLVSIGDTPVASLAEAEAAGAALKAGQEVRVGLMRKEAAGRWRFEALSATVAVAGDSHTVSIRSVAK